MAGDVTDMHGAQTLVCGRAMPVGPKPAVGRGLPSGRTRTVHGSPAPDSGLTH
jgi:hypothetical protein